MDLRAAFLLLASVGTLSSVTGRAVNISNTWVLPEEGFPVFYRYFRDRISWYEADAVCQFHHANLVTVDSTSQYDAIRAYLRELDITESIWIGLQRNSNKPEFIWTDFHLLTNNDHWQEPIPKVTEALCVSMDPATDYRWHPLTCGGPSVSSFICELPVPTWATGPKGCLLTELPSLTVLYNPEQSALELTSDCGLDGTKRIACKGNANRDQMIKQLACTITDDFDDKSTKLPATTQHSPITENDEFTNTVYEYSSSTRHRRDTEATQKPTESGVFEISTSFYQPTSLTVGVSTNFSPKTSNSETPSREIMEESTTFKPEDTSSIENFESSSVDFETSDFPSVINQGQLFGIIENGTNYDIIELNETGTEESVKKEGVINQEMIKETFKKVSKEFSETPIEVVSTSQSIQKESQSSKLLKKLYGKNLNDLQQSDDKTLNKEVEMIPPLPGSPMMKLNRTHRKQLPIIEDFDDNDEIDLDIDNKLIEKETEEVQHKTVEVKLHKNGEKNESNPIIYVTTKTGAKKFKKSMDVKKELIKKEITSTPQGDSEDFKEEMKGENPIKEISTIKPQIINENNKKDNKGNEENKDEINDDDDEDRSKYTVSIDDMISTTQPPLISSTIISKDLELIIDELNKTNNNNGSFKISPKQFDETSSDKPDVDFQDDIANFEGTGEPKDTPEVQPRPNRQRQLTRNQRKTFYPYFFSRMLG
ncbi:uncharacterized protein [Onthophagus taurus]|uniref:uncharacterized protein n=1 Tax=Onthophagus taurus TaxID=166361 RepID=UPI000C1FEDB3|nr:uncharacterized protein LOC111420649 [Onthophagus taurus]